MLQTSVIVGLVLLPIILFFFKDLKIIRDPGEKIRKDRLTFTELAQAALAISGFVALAVFFVGTWIIDANQPQGVSCGRYEDLDACVRNAERKFDY